MSGGGIQFISIQPEELKFQVELDKQSYCDLKVANNTEHHVAFKVKTTSPKKYFVRPNTGVIHPWDSYIIRVTLQAPREYPLDMQCKDKFLLQSTIVPPQTELDNLPAHTFSKESGKTIEECKLKVVYSIPGSARDSDDEASEGAERFPESNAVQRLKDERDAIIQQSHHLQQELELLKKRGNRRSDPGFSFKFAMLVGFIGLMVGFLTNLVISSPAAPRE